MIRTQRIALVALTAALVLIVAVPALGADHAQADEADTTETTVTAVPILAGNEPAVVVPTSEIDDVQHPWTDRFLIPILVVTAIVLIIGVVIGYNHSIRNRYKVIA